MALSRCLHILISFVFTGLATYAGSISAAESNGLAQYGQCSPTLVAEKNRIFDDLLNLRSKSSTLVSEQAFRKAALEYVNESEHCYESLYASEPGTASPLLSTQIDNGGVWFGTTPGSLLEGKFVLGSRKWGAGSPFSGNTGPGIKGGVVTYSFIADGVSNAAEDSGSNTAISSLSTFETCFFAEIATTFAAWSAVADIDFTQVNDNGLALDAAGASGDIRIGAHSFDGGFGILAHAYFPPPNGVSAAGDLHLDTAENWTCDTSGIDIGIVVTHEVGHSIGLDHEAINSAIMRGSYNPAVSSPLTDDINGLISIYGRRPAQNIVIPPIIFLLLSD